MNLTSQQYMVLLKLHSIHIEANECGLLNVLGLGEEPLDTTATAIRDFLSQPVPINENEKLWTPELTDPQKQAFVEKLPPVPKLWSITYKTMRNIELYGKVRKMNKNQAEHHARTVWGATDILSIEEVK